MRKLAFVAFSVVLFSCNLMTPDKKPEAIARVNDNWLYKSDLEDLVPKGTSKDDSISIVRNFIDHWARQILLSEKADENLNSQQKEDFDQLVSQYKIDLYTKAYIEAIVKRSVDTAVSEQELNEFYKDNKANFKTTGALVKLRYIEMLRENPKYATIREKFFNYKKADEKFWDSNTLQLKSISLNDTMWIDMPQIYGRLRFINPDNRDKYIVAGKSAEVVQGNTVFLIKVANMIDRNQIAPYEYLKPTIREVILNRRKLQLIKKFEKEITDDAIKEKEYEVYN